MPTILGSWKVLIPHAWYPALNAWSPAFGALRLSWRSVRYSVYTCTIARVGQSPDWISFSRTCGVTKKTRLDFHKDALFGGFVRPVISVVHTCNQLFSILFKMSDIDLYKLVAIPQLQMTINNFLPAVYPQYYGKLLFVAWPMALKEQQKLSSLQISGENIEYFH